MMKKKTIITAPFRKLVTEIKNNEVRRTTLGISLCVGSFFYLFFLSDIQGRRDFFGMLLILLDTAAFVAGLMIFNKSREDFKRIMNRGLLETAGIIFAIVSAKIIYDCMDVTFRKLSGGSQLMLFISILFITWYFIRLGRFVFRLIKDTFTKSTKLVKGKKMKSVTELWDTVLKNILSIAGTIALLYKAMEPLVNKILGV